MRSEQQERELSFLGITSFLEEQKGGSVKTLERFKGDYSNFLGQ